MTEVKDRRVTLSFLWIFMLLNYIYADIFTLSFNPVLRPGETVDITEGSALAFALLMETAIAIVLLSRVPTYRVNRWANIIVTIVFFGFNLIGLPTYPSASDKFLILVGLVWNVLIGWYAWKWV